MAKILVVDDSLFARLNICNILKSAGYETIEAENGLEGLRIIAETPPDCILTDLLMPEMDGLGFLAALQQQGNRLPVVVLTADIQEAKRRQCRDLGAAGFINKPPQKQEILSVVNEMLRAGKKG